MIIYQAEKDAGLTELLSAKSSIVYASLAEKSDNLNNDSKSILRKDQALAGLEDSDLYYTQSILVTTSWNKNDDIFDAKEVWAAKDTPEDKPTNLEHDENAIVGHITSNWPIDDDGNILDQETQTQNLPEKFHIVTGSVIYKGYTDPELRSRANTLIEEIENGTKYVSMECFFKGFDYGLINKTNGSYHILPRNEETAFLTKHLRSYGGQGEHQDYKIGRVLRQITFSGKGFVNKPANPESIIFTKDSINLDKELATVKKSIEKNNIFELIGVFSNQANLKETNMSVETQIADTTEEATPVVAETAPVIENTSVVEHEEAAKKMKDEMVKKEDEIKKMKAAIANLESELQAANEALAGYKTKEAETMKKEKKAKRMASLVESGVDTETAEATVDKFEHLDDETFASLTSLVAAKKTEKKKTPEMETDASVLESVEIEESVNLTVAGDEESQTQNTRAALVDFVCMRLGKKLNKGE